MTDKVITLPAIALRGMTILPGMVAHFDLSRKKSIEAVEYAMLSDQMVFLIAQTTLDVEDPDQKDLFTTGVITSIKQIIKLQNDIVRILVEGQEKARLVKLEGSAQEFLMADVIQQDGTGEEVYPEVREGMLLAVQDQLIKYNAVNTKMGKDFIKHITEQTDVEHMMDYAVHNLPVFYEEKQKYIEAVTLEERYEVLMTILVHEINVYRIKNEFQAKVKERVDKNQKEYILREQLKVIREELGETNTETETDTFLAALKKLKANKEIKDKIKKEIDRFKNISSNSSESAVTRGYIETLLELPWDKMSKDNKDLKNAERILEAEHYGLPKVKERMLEFLAVRNLTKMGESPIICLVGPPGTGKTSIAHSVARALDKQYVRISLGGVRDEAEIRGHRRTYVGAMPGRIANGLRIAGVKNPLMILDEIDKVSSDYKGDTSSALLEVLDSEQNVKFRDHYVEIPLDLSEVMFIATANSVADIPRPLLDRMELIEVSSYTDNEKLHIAMEHLIPKQIKKHGLKQVQLTIEKEAMEHIIRYYTKEAGVRNLERKIGEICRKAARGIYEDKQKHLQISTENLEYYLGMEKFSFDMANDMDDIGVVRGLAWTSVGGDTLEIEVNVMPGKGEIQLTGQLGDVMKESAKAGMSYIRSKGKELGIKDEFFSENDIHIHIPQGAVPKDGPSAGITMTTAMISAITQIPVHANVAMTGEITLRGRVLPIGGLKEKTLAAKNAGIKIICIPKKNKKDMEEISDEIKEGLEIVYAESMDEVLKIALVRDI
ncbi:MAG: endopeptidase La [Lachnospiraceae bacterium]